MTRINFYFLTFTFMMFCTISINAQNLDIEGDIKVQGRITDLSDPISPQDAATKAYVDMLEAQILELQLEVGIKVEDVDGNIYNTVKIGDQVWLKENLRTTKFNDGTPIPEVSGSSWNDLWGPAYCVYDTVGENYATFTIDTFGFLYNYYTVADTNSLNVCPVGWHVPSDTELTALGNNLGGGAVAGGKMKESGTYHWNSPNTGATNESNFTAVPAGWRSGANNAMQQIGAYAYFWSSTQANGSSAWNYDLKWNGTVLDRNSGTKRGGYSVRCIKD